MKQPKNKFIYQILEVTGAVYVFPLGEKDFNLEWERDNDTTRRIYKKSFNGSLTFTGEAFAYLHGFESQREIRCRSIYLSILKLLDDGRRENVFEGFINLNDGVWDIDRCVLKIKPASRDLAQCVDDNKTTVYNVAEGIDVRHQAYVMDTDAQIELRSFAENYSYSIRPKSVYMEDFWQAGDNPSDGGWAIVKNYYEETYIYSTNSFSGSKRQSTWGRIKTVSTTPLPEPWVNIGGNNYAKPLETYDCKEREWRDQTISDYTNKYEKICRYLGDNSGEDKPQIYKNGIPLNLILPNLIRQMCGLSTKSEFFQINAGSTNPPNYVTGETSEVNNILVFQKRDIKFPNSNNLLTVLNSTFEILIGGLCKYFNLQWDITESGEFILEHISYFEKDEFKDLTLPENLKYLSGKNAYSYETGRIPERERIVVSEEPSYGDFRGTDIVFKSGCVTLGKNAVETTTIQDLFTDVQYITEISAIDGEKLSDAGLVLIATRNPPIILDNSEVVYRILSKDSILGGNQINNTLSIAHLMESYHKHNRPLRRGLMNLKETVFESTRKVKKGVTVTIPFCFDESFNPNDTVKTMFGDGEVDKAKFKFSDMTLELDLVYEADEPEDYAFFATDLYRTVGETPIEIQLADAIVGQGQLILWDYVIVHPPLMGTITNTGATSFLYTPSPGMTGTDFIAFKVEKFGGAQSNTALLAIKKFHLTEVPI